MRNPLPRLQSATTKSMVRLHLGLAAVTYIPLLFTKRGWVSADTKTYLYTDPGRLLGRAWSMWDPSIGMGTVTHQSIGYLWPMGPFFWLAEAIGLPDWTAQRIWWGTIMFAAGAGVAYLLRVLGWRGPSVTAAVFIYALTPYVLTLVSRLSAILLPFSALPWLLALTIQAVRHRGWRYPALFALVIATCGSVNATALILVGFGPVLWLLHAVWGAREVPWKTVAIATAKIGSLTVAASLWWIAGLSVQSTNGIEILRYTETAEVVSSVSVSHEVLRSLGYWFFYGTDRLGPWIEPSVGYTQWPWLLALTYLIPILAIGGALIARWRHRAYFVLLVFVGLTLAVGAYPWDNPPLFGAAIKAFQASDAGLAMRSLPRAVPLVALGMAVLLGSGVAALIRRWPRFTRPAGWGSAALAVLALPALWLGHFVPENLKRPEEIPDYWQQAAAHLDNESHDTRVLTIPGSDFGSYRWGNTVDPILPGLIDRASVQRELIPYGSPASANLLNAFDLDLQERTADPEALAAMARLMRAGDILVDSDMQYERFNTPRPRNLWDFVNRAPGLDKPSEFGPGNPNRTIDEVQLDDELLLLTDPSIEDPPELASFPVTNPLPIVTTHSPDQPLLVAGDGAGLVDAAGAGLIDGTELIRYSASMDEEEIAAAVQDNASLLLTDSNRKRGERWTTVRHTRGYTETANGGPLGEDLGDNRLPMFPDASTDTQTVRVPRGGIDAQATSYGNPITYSPEERPILAIDGDPRTAWRTGAFVDTRGERIEISMADPVTADSVRLLQPTSGPITRHITKARLTFDDGESMDVELNAQSRNEPGQVVDFSQRTFEKLSIEILEDSSGDLPRYAGESSVGFAEVEVLAIDPAQPQPEELIRLPTDLLASAGEDSADNPLAVSVTRQRQDPTDPTRNDEERSLMRLFDLPTSRQFGLTGEARLSARAAPQFIDELLGRPHETAAVPWVRASDDLNGSIMTPSAAFDGDPATAWTSVRSRPDNQWVEVLLPEETTIDHLPLSIVADGLHSVPTEVELWVDGEPVERIPVPPIEDGDKQNSVSEVDLPVKEVSGEQFRVKVTAQREVTTNDWVSARPIPQPVAIAEIGLPGPKVPELSETFDTGCTSDLLTIDDEPLPIQITGTIADALAGRPLSVRTCGDAPVDLDGGSHTLRSAQGRDTGIDLDSLVLRSDADGQAFLGAETLMTKAGAEPTTAQGQPKVEVVNDSPDHMELKVSGATPNEPFWLVQGESFNEGWEASVANGETLSGPQLVNGYANGWVVVPDGESLEIDLTFAPQKRVNVSLIVSAIAALGCVALLFRRPKLAVVAPSAMPEPYSEVLAFRYHGALPSRRTAYVAGVGLALLSYVLVGHPLVALLVGLCAGFGTRHEKFRRWLLLGSPAALGLCAAYVLYIQLRHSPVASFDWPIELEEAHPAGWLAVLLLVADVVVGRIWQSRSTEPTD